MFIMNTQALTQYIFENELLCLPLEGYVLTFALIASCWSCLQSDTELSPLLAI